MRFRRGEPPTPETGEVGAVPAVPADTAPAETPAVSMLVLRVEYENGAHREFTALWPVPCLLRIGATAEEAGLPAGMTDPERKEPLIACVFGGNPAAGGVTVSQSGLL